MLLVLSKSAWKSGKKAPFLKKKTDLWKRYIKNILITKIAPFNESAPNNERFYTVKWNSGGCEIVRESVETKKSLNWQ